MNAPMILKRFSHAIVKNSPKILTGCAVSGVIGTVIFAVKATPKAQIVLEEKRREYEGDMPWYEQAKAVAPVYIPTLAMGGVTIGCIIGATAIASKRNAVLASLYSASELALKNYQQKVVETIGERKEHEVRASMAKDEMMSNPVSHANVIETGYGGELCYDELSGRYFYSSMDRLRRAENAVNRKIISEMWVSLNEFYSEIGLEPIELGKDVGWNVDSMISLGFTTQMSDDDRPCIVMQFYNRPSRYR